MCVKPSIYASSLVAANAVYEHGTYTCIYKYILQYWSEPEDCLSAPHVWTPNIRILRPKIGWTITQGVLKLWFSKLHIYSYIPHRRTYSRPSVR